jgi:hypothetical protein
LKALTALRRGGCVGAGFPVVQGLKHPDMGMHHRPAIFRSHQHHERGSLPVRFLQLAN